ncbi:MAG: hypothetical protein FWF87_06405 [Synergistaceae bacterium]|nr:hypothetical protein [Synergistaceae bacterium]
MLYNYGKNVEVLEKNADLRGYSIFVAKVYEGLNEGKKLADAIRTAVEECLKEGILAGST